MTRTTCWGLRNVLACGAALGVGLTCLALQGADRRESPARETESVVSGSASSPLATPLSQGAQPVQASEKSKEITFDTIKFDIKKGQKFKRSMLTPEIEALKTQKVRLRGYMYPTFQQTGITQFVLVRDNQECCFGPGAMIYDCVMVEMAEGKSTDYYIRPIAVEGTFDIKPVDDGDGGLLVLYHLRGDGVK